MGIQMARGWLTIRLTSGCSLCCVFCQNFGTSWPVHGEPVATWRLAAMMLALQDRGCQHINLVASVELSDDREMEPSPSAEASQRPKGSSASRDHEPVDGATRGCGWSPAASGGLVTRTRSRCCAAAGGSRVPVADDGAVRARDQLFYGPGP